MTSINGIKEDYFNCQLSYSAEPPLVSPRSLNKEPYPDYNIMNLDDDHTIVEVAVAGWAKEEIDVLIGDGILTVMTYQHYSEPVEKPLFAIEKEYFDEYVLLDRLKQAPRRVFTIDVGSLNAEAAASLIEKTKEELTTRSSSEPLQTRSKAQYLNDFREERMLHRWISRTSFMRKFAIGAGAKVAEAVYRDGLLRILVKREQMNATKVEIR